MSYSQNNSQPETYSFPLSPVWSLRPNMPLLPISLQKINFFALLSPAKIQPCSGLFPDSFEV